MGAPSDIERLIELGLNRYGAGDLDGALLMWEEALAIDPDNARANSYIEYVRLHYEMLADGELAITQGEDVPFAIVEEPEYHIEIAPDELVQRDSGASSEPIDAAWFDDAATHDVIADVAADQGEQPLELEPPAPEINFDDATREYHGSPTKPGPPVRADASPEDFSETGTTEFQQDQFTGGFQPEGTPVGFSNQETEIRKRDFGFVQATAQQSAADKSPGGPPTMDAISLGELTLDMPEGATTGEREHTPYAAEHEEPDEPEATDEADELDDDRDLLEALPVPRRAHIETQDIPLLSSKALTKELPDGGQVPSSKAVTKELPDSRRPPARRDSSELSQAEVMLSHAATRDFSRGQALESEQPKIDIGAPTRELGIRPRSPSNRPGTLPNPVDEEAPTKQSDVRAIREAAREGRARQVGETTRNDIAPGFDPIDVCSAQILDEIDTDAPAHEAHEDQTRRRIGALLERAVAWNQGGETEKAVCAVDLALNEDPNSALGQKLITRNRETIMLVFQGYLGDLDRQPQLAKPLHELQNAPISPRAAFLLSRIDGTLTIDELLDVSGMPRLEAFRHLCQLYLRGILR